MLTKKNLLQVAYKKLRDFFNLEKQILVEYNCFPDPRGPPANIMKRGIILPAETKRVTTNWTVSEPVQLQYRANQEISCILWLNWIQATKRR